MTISQETVVALRQAHATEVSNVALAAALAASHGLLALHDELEVKDFEHALPYRRRMRGTMKTKFVAPFAAYVAQHVQKDSAIFLSPSEMSATAVLDFGHTDAPGHCENRAYVRLEELAAYKALLTITSCRLSQREFSEWLEEWAHIVVVREGMEPGSAELDLKKCIAGVRSVTVEAARKMESTVGNFSQNLTTAEQIALQAKGELKLPPFLFVTMQPYMGIKARTFVVRVSSLTGEEKPVFRLAILGFEQHKEDMADEFRTTLGQVVQEAIKASDAEKEMPMVVIGDYEKR